ncbi:hypothetical protein GCM10007036_14430 [Alsobacter metallidurans]|uniref:Uncharacterized protein n=1 Tax=Alsobacter metallidurans TaxID=340221 RepID=A0A917MGG5_9HYPH|nr:hypothetical protein [Alsobacter metallidurans]GGH14852.1 hypothetical protein GCM10007036_14430 [Alsobacter metallidurans]
MRLLVTSPFLDRKVGDYVTNPAEQASILASGRAAFVLLVPDAEPAPASAPKEPAPVDKPEA